MDEEDNLDIFCEAVSDEADEEEEEDSQEAELYACGEHCDEQNEVGSRREIPQRLETNQKYGNDPTEALQNVLMDQESGFPVNIKEEPMDPGFLLFQHERYGVGAETTSDQFGDFMDYSKSSFIDYGNERLGQIIDEAVGKNSKRSGCRTSYTSVLNKQASKVTAKSFHSQESICLVCKSPFLAVGQSKRLPKNHPFCKKCKKAYFYQQSKAINHRRSCTKDNDCVVDFRQKGYGCPACHFRKFNEILDKLLCTSSGDQVKQILDGHRSNRQSMNEEDLVSDALQRYPLVTIERLSGAVLEQYGIATEHPVHSSPRSLVERYRQKQKSSKRGVHIKRKRLRSSSSTETDEFANSYEDYALPGRVTASKSKSDQMNDERLPEFSQGQETLAGSNQSLHAGNQNISSKVLESIKVYVFTCGHACAHCNSNKSKKWLEKSGFFTANPLPTPHVSSSNLASGITQNSRTSTGLKSSLVSNIGPSTSHIDQSDAQVKDASSIQPALIQSNQFKIQPTKNLISRSILPTEIRNMNAPKQISKQSIINNLDIGNITNAVILDNPDKNKTVVFIPETHLPQEHSNSIPLRIQESQVIGSTGLSLISTQLLSPQVLSSLAHMVDQNHK